MRTVFLLILMVLLTMASCAARADLVIKSRETGTELRLQDAPCSHAETLAAIKEEWRPKFRNARIVDRSGNILHYGCWIERDEGVAIIVFDDGSSTAMRLGAFKDTSV